jgi:protein disulfide isomerase family A protein 3
VSCARTSAPLCAPAQTSDYGLELEEGKKQVGVGIEDGDKRYGMVGEEFSVDNLKAFCDSFLAGELTPSKIVEPYSPPPPGVDDDDIGEVDESGVVTADPTNFESVMDQSKNVLIEFYAPWCGHCKMLKPEYAKVGTAFEGDDGVVVAKMDADQHKVPDGWDVQGFPTIFFVPRGGPPVPYEGARSADALVEFVKKNRV